MVVKANGIPCPISRLVKSAIAIALALAVVRVLWQVFNTPILSRASGFSTSHHGAAVRGHEPPLNLSTCIHVKFSKHNRDGNNIIQLLNVVRLLNYCTGTATGWVPRLLASMWLPSVITVGGPNAYGAKSLARIARHCDVLDLSSHEYSGYLLLGFAETDDEGGRRDSMLRLLADKYPTLKCPLTDYALQHLVLPQAFTSRIHQYLSFDANGYAADLRGAAVAHLRGGDIMLRGDKFRISAAYSQPPCSYYRAAYEHSRALRLIIVAEDRRNPCVDVLQASLKDAIDVTLMVSTPPSLALTVLMRAPILITGASTFSSAAMTLPLVDANFDFVRTVYVSPLAFLHPGRFPDLATELSMATRVCTVQYDHSGLRPWTSSAHQLELLITLPSHVGACVTYSRAT